MERALRFQVREKIIGRTCSSPEGFLGAKSKAGQYFPLSNFKKKDTDTLIFSSLISSIRLGLSSHRLGRTRKEAPYLRVWCCD